MKKMQNKKDLQSTNLDFIKLPEIYESHGVSKEVISSFIALQRRIQHAQNISRN